MNDEQIVKNIIELKEDVKEIRSQMVTQDDKREIMGAIENLTSIVEKIRDD